MHGNVSRPGRRLIRRALVPLLALLCLVLSEVTALRPGGPVPVARAAAVPTLTTVAFSGTPGLNGNVTVTVTGQNFGGEPAAIPDSTAGSPVYDGYTGHDFSSGALAFADNATTAPAPWSAGQPGNHVGVVVSQYTGTSISYSFGDGYGPTFSSPSGGFYLNAGDPFTVYVGGQFCSGTVSFSVPITCPVINTVTFGSSPSNPSITINGSGFGSSLPAATVSAPIGSGPTYGGQTFTGNDYNCGVLTLTFSGVEAGEASAGSACPTDGKVHYDYLGLFVTSYSDLQVQFTLGSFYSLYTPTGLIAGNPFTITVAGASCSGTVTYTAPVSCTSSVPAPPPAPTLSSAETHPGNSTTPYQTTIFGQITGASPSTTYALTFSSASSAASCGAAGTQLGATSVTTDASGTAVFSPTLQGTFNTAGTQISATAAISPTSPGIPPSPASGCITAAQGNDTWNTAMLLDTTSAVPITQSIYQQGEERWYDFPVQPGAHVHIDFTGPAGSVVTLHTDIQQLYNALANPTTAARVAGDLAIQDAPSGYLPSGYLPSGYLPSGYLPSGYLPSGYLPSGYLPSGYLPSGYLPSGYLPSGYLPSGYLPSGYLPSGYLPSGYLPSGYLPSGYLPSGYLSGPYTSVPWWSLMALATSPTATALSIDRNTWDLTGHLYVRVAGPIGPFSLTVTQSGGACNGLKPITSTNITPPTTMVNSRLPQTLILLDSTRWDNTRVGDSANDVAALQTKLAAFAGRTDVNGQIIDLSTFQRIVDANAQADTSALAACPAAKNLVAAEIKSIVQYYRNAYQSNGTTTIKYIVLVGDDHSVPFFRYPDESGLAPENGYIPPVGDTSPTQASLRNNYILGQDEYGSSNSVPRSDHSLPIPDIAVGRLVDTAAEASHMLDVYTATNGVITPTSALTTGYDFVSDAAISATTELSAGITPAGCGSSCPVVDQLIATQGAPPGDSSIWTADNLRQQLYGKRHDIVFMAGHFSAGNLLASDYTTQLSASEVASSTANLTDTLVLALGCHGGLNIPGQDAITGVSPAPDWPEAMAQKGATLLAATGYAYGDTVLTEYGERLFVDVARQLRTGSGSVPIGLANVRAKQDYLNTHLDLTGIDEKTLLETTLYGLPMLQVNMQGQHLSPPSSSSIVGSTAPLSTGQAGSLGTNVTSTGTVSVNPVSTLHTTPLTGTSNNTVIASWYTGASGVVAHPLDPVFPLQLYNASVPSQVLRGVGFRGGTFADTTGVTPLTVAPGTETSVGHPAFFSDVLYPTQVWSANYYDTIDGLNGGTTSLAVAPVQYQSSPVGSMSGTFRVFSNLQFKLYYLNSNVLAPTTSNTAAFNAAFDPPPNIAGATASTDPTTGNTTFTVRVQNTLLNGNQDLQDVWVTYNDPNSASAGHQWTSLDLVQDASDQTLWTGSVSGLSNATVYMVQAANATGLVSLDTNNGAYFRIAPQTPPTQVSPTIALQSPPTSGSYGSTASFTVGLQNGGSGLGGQSVVVHLGNQSGVGTTDASGVTTVTLPLNQSPGSYNLWASYGGVLATNSDGSVATIYHPASSATTPPSVSFTIQQAATSLTLAPTSKTVTYSSTEYPGIAATLTAKGSGLGQKSVYFTISPTSGSGTPVQKVAITDASGKATLGALSLPFGTYSVNAAFALGSANPAAPSTDPNYAGSNAPGPVSLTINAAPVVTGITVPTAPVALGATVPISATFTDADVEAGAYTATVTYQTLPGSVTPSSGTCQVSPVTAPITGGAPGSVNGNCTFPTTGSDGIYYVTVTVTDPSGASSVQGASNLASFNPAVGSSTTGDIVVYNPAAGFVTGGGWIVSPQNTHLPYMQVSGKATFGFVSKYVKGSTVPTGNTDFQFEDGGLHFQSSSYTWMVVGGGQAQYQGTGTVNGGTGYTFRLTARDAKAVGSTYGSDSFRMQIWDSSSNLVYDNGAQSPLGGGDIVIHSS